MALSSAGWRKLRRPCLTRLETAGVAIIARDIYVNISTSHCADPVSSSAALPVCQELIRTSVVLIPFPSPHCVSPNFLCAWCQDWSAQADAPASFACPNLFPPSHPCGLRPGHRFSSSCSLLSRAAPVQPPCKGIAFLLVTTSPNLCRHCTCSF